MNETTVNEPPKIPDPTQLNFIEFYKAHEGEIKNAVPTRRNYSVNHLATQDKNGKIVEDIILKTKDGKSKSLRELLPEDCDFLVGKTFEYKSETKKVTFDPTRFQYRGSILSLLHEICHARQGVKPFSPFSETGRNGLQKFSMLVSSILKKAYIDSRKAAMEAVGKIDDPTIYATAFATLPADIDDKAYEQRAEAERNAWAEALRIRRKLEDEGYNVLGEFDNFAQLRTYIAFMLSAYEFRMAMDKKVFTKKNTADVTTQKRAFVR